MIKLTVDDNSITESGPHRCIQQRYGPNTKHDITMQDASSSVIHSGFRVNFTEERAALFWSKVDRNGPVVREELGPCWIWIGARFVNGYGNFKINRKASVAHRISLAMTIGEIPPGMMACHRCDAPSCVNPSHLFLGTCKDNMHDAAKKGRMAKGVNHGSITHPEKLVRGDTHHASVLTSSNVIEIRNLSREGIAHSVLSKRFGTSRQTISRAVRGATWKHLCLIAALFCTGCATRQLSTAGLSKEQVTLEREKIAEAREVRKERWWAFAETVGKAGVNVGVTWLQAWLAKDEDGFKK